MRRAQTHNRLAFKYGADHGIGALTCQSQILLHALCHKRGILRTAKHPQFMYRGNVHMENVCQPPHFQWFVLQNRTHQLMDSDASVPAAPDIDADSRQISNLIE